MYGVVRREVTVSERTAKQVDFDFDGDAYFLPNHKFICFLN